VWKTDPAFPRAGLDAPFESLTYQRRSGQGKRRNWQKTPGSIARSTAARDFSSAAQHDLLLLCHHDDAGLCLKLRYKLSHLPIVLGLKLRC